MPSALILFCKVTTDDIAARAVTRTDCRHWVVTTAASCAGGTGSNFGPKTGCRDGLLWFC
jgi:hypothetical protein